MKTSLPARSPFASLVLAITLMAIASGYAQAQTTQTNDAIARIREEGLNHSKVTETLSYLSDVIGQRLTGSPNLKRANEWTRDTLTGWGLTNAHMEEWGPFGRGWSLKRFSAQIIEPQTIPLAAQPNAWSPGFDAPLTADVVYLDATNEAGLEKYKGKLKGAVVLASPPRDVKLRFEPMALRMTESNLLQLANAGPPPAGGQDFARFAGRRFGGGATNESDQTNAPQNRRFRRAGGATNAPSGEAGPRSFTTNVNRFAGRGPPQNRFLSFLTKEGAALVVNPSSIGDSGTIFVAAASVPAPAGQDTNNFSFANRPRPWSTNAPAFPPQITLAVEDYNRLVRMIQQGVNLKMAVDLQVQYHNDDLMARNTVAEIPGTDLKDEVVMLGGHMDSWHSGTGATDNGAGVAACMEAVRIIEALKLKPRRTIRIGLWTGEEQGLLGSHAYVSNHFGYYSNQTNSEVARSPKAQSESDSDSRGETRGRTPTRKLICTREYERFSVYFNLDNGVGKVRGIYLQGNESARPIFRKWLEPFADLGASTITLSNTGGTDHQSFDGIGLPGFQFIQDQLDYNTRTHHSNEDVFDRIQADDLKQASVILAAFTYQAAMMDNKFPRKPEE
jgi:carboxypeptidase Q